LAAKKGGLAAKEIGIRELNHSSKSILKERRKPDAKLQGFAFGSVI
jgi:hypothetical protein